MPTERTIHVVDDDAAVRHSLERLLGSMGLATVSYTTPGAFLLAAPHLLGGCVLLDVKMPGISGLEVQARLRTIGFVPPIIVITGQGDIQTAVLAMKAGAFDFLEKPYEDEVLLAAIEAALAASPDDHIRQAVDSAQRIARLSPREREVLDGAEVKTLLDGGNLPPMSPSTPPKDTADHTQQVLRPETGGRRLPGLAEGERPAPA